MTSITYRVKDAGGAPLGIFGTARDAFNEAQAILGHWGDVRMHSRDESVQDAAWAALLAADGLSLSRDAYLRDLRREGVIKLRYGTRAVVIQQVTAP